MNKQAKTDWKSFYNEGLRFLEIVEKGSKKGDKFTPEILYNMASMSIEKLFMAYFLKVGSMPYNHTLIDLVDSIKELEKIPESLEKNLLAMNGFQEICSIEQYNRKEPTGKDVEFFLDTARESFDYITRLVE
jgi:HEPN domain-containing protein